MKYKIINTQADLDNLNGSVCWDDSDLIEMYVSERQQSYYPEDIQYSSGQKSFHYHCLYNVCSSPKSHLELIFAGTEIAGHHKLTNMSLNGRVNAGGGVELINYKSSLTLKCAKIFYRFIELYDYEIFGYFLKPGVLDYPPGEFNSEGYYHMSCDDSHLLITETGSGVEISISNSDNNSNNINLTHDQIMKLAEIFRQSSIRR